MHSDRRDDGDVCRLGMPFGASLRVADKDEKALMLGYSISGVLGGVSEPALYGCGFKYGRCLTCMAIGGAVGALLRPWATLRPIPSV